jgi:hypothetical protein
LLPEPSKPGSREPVNPFRVLSLIPPPTETAYVLDRHGAKRGRIALAILGRLNNRYWPVPFEFKGGPFEFLSGTLI